MALNCFQKYPFIPIYTLSLSPLEKLLIQQCRSRGKNPKPEDREKAAKASLGVRLLQSSHSVCC